MSGDPVYLGDGAYAWHDGFQFWLAANHPGSHERVALEPGALREFLRYVEHVDGVKITMEPVAEKDGT